MNPIVNGKNLYTIDFKFKIKDKVETLNGEIGFIEICAVKEKAIKLYLVKITHDNHLWYMENQLTLFNIPSINIKMEESIGHKDKTTIETIDKSQANIDIKGE